MTRSKHSNPRRTIGPIAAIATAATVGLLSGAQAAPLNLNVAFDVGRGQVQPNTFPSDPVGLDGARFAIDATFADGATFDRSFASAETTTVTITGASVASTNGTFDVMQNVGLFQGSTGGGFGLLAGGSFFSFLNGFAVPDIIRSVKLDANGTVGAQSNGSPVTLSLLQGLSFRGIPETGSASLFSGFQNSNYTIGNFSISASEVMDVAPVPLPAALPALLLGLAAMGVVTRRCKTAAAV
ncbi:hypothetical protein [Jannaschia sp. LMIT008]|uniref:hypothetical protein n=1 Tax=Jannaschia maritima TaxID=3032585 RepID=UPI00281288CB|nr:hypothetical protein [Jannaschia sp. LMIT008]